MVTKLAIASAVDAKALHALMSNNASLTPTTKVFSGRFLGKKLDMALLESQAGIGKKDLSLAAEFARSVGADIPIADQVRGSVRTAMIGKIGN